jgi:hypothetical protein
MSESNSSTDVGSRKKTVRDVLIFQVKLWLEGFKDIVLMPLSAGAAVLDHVFRRGEARGAVFRDEAWAPIRAQGGSLR